MHWLYSRLALSVMLLALVPATGADVITSGGSTTNLNPANAGDLPTGSALASISSAFAGALTGNPHGSYTASVFMNGNGGLDFVYNFSNTGTADFVDSVTMSNFSGFTTDVFATGTGNAPLSAESTGANPDVIKFFFSNGTTNDDVKSGQSSDTLVIATNAKAFATGVFTLQDGDTASVAAFEPRATPEPSSMLLFGTGLTVFAATLRRHVKKQPRVSQWHA